MRTLLFKYIKKVIRFILFRCPFIEIIKVDVNAPIYARYFVYTKKRRIYPRPTKAYSIADKKRVIYLKVNQMTDYSFACIQHWVNISHEMNATSIFVCDNLRLEKQMLRVIRFNGDDVIIIPSMRKDLKGIIENMATPRWQNAGIAHYTPFYHAQKNGIDSFWEIDADDTMICLKTAKAAEALIKAEELLNGCAPAAISLDMWWTRTHGKYWTWGVAYINGTTRFINEIESVNDRNWWNPYKEYDIDVTADWFFTYLRDYRKISIETFYIEASWFIHWCSFIRNAMHGYVCYWKDGWWHAPIMESIFLNTELGQIVIQDCKKIDVGISIEDGSKFIENNVTRTKTWDIRLRRLLCMGDFSTKADYWW